MIRKKLFDHIERLCMFVLIVTLAGMCTFIAAQVFFRYVLNKPLSWTEEAARHLMIWSAFSGSAIGYRKKAHLGIDILVQYLEKQGSTKARYIHLVLNVLTIVLAALIVYFGIFIVQKTMRQLSSALSIPMGYIYAALPTGFFFIGLFALERIVEDFITHTKNRMGNRIGAEQGESI